MHCAGCDAMGSNYWAKGRNPFDTAPGSEPVPRQHSQETDMKVVYTKDEIEVVMKAHYEQTHYGKDSKRPISFMTMSPKFLTLVMGPVPEDEESE